VNTPPLDSDQRPAEESLLGPLKALSRFADLPHIVASGSRADNTTTRVSYGFRLANIGLVISAQTHSEVMEPLPIFPLPNTPCWFLGLSNLRGNIVPVYDLEGAFDVHDDDQEKRYLMVLGKTELVVGLMIRGLPQPLMLEKGHIMTERPPLPNRLCEFASNAYMIDKRAWIEFDHKGFFQALVGEHSAQPETLTGRVA
jgi:twitching motility protein PilI